MDKSQEDQKSSSNPSAGTELIPAAPTPSAEVSPELKPSHPIEDVLLEFMGDMHNIRNTATVTLPHIIEWLQSERKKTRQSLVKFEERKEGRTTIYSATKAGEAAEMMRLVRYMEDLQNDKTWSVLVESTFTHIFAKLDSFIGVLLRVIYLKKDELLRGIERQITLTQILNFESLSQIKEYLLDQEIDSFRRDSYMEQFVALEKKFSVVLRKFPEWGEFVELTQRRNILMHNGGVVSEQYLTMCKREGHQWKEEPKIGEALTMLPEYYSRSIFLVEKVGFMLAHTLWRKVFPGEISIAQEAANSAIYSLLERKRWLTAGEFGQFALTEMMKKNLDEADLRIRIVNTSIGLKFSGKAAAASALLDSIDWSASYRDFKLATATLMHASGW